MSIHTIVIDHKEEKLGEFHFDDFRHLNVVETFYCGTGDMVRELQKELKDQKYLIGPHLKRIDRLQKENAELKLKVKKAEDHNISQFKRITSQDDYLVKNGRTIFEQIARINELEAELAKSKKAASDNWDTANTYIDKSERQRARINELETKVDEKEN